ncbi:MAG: hypothetical protein IT235_00685 [Bacteroidia bacterium]|nr:hypothetical protein [Bacteroidia bacterium]
MTKVRYISLFIFIIAGSLAVARPKDSLNRVDKNGWRQGHWIKKDENNKPVYDGVFANDKPVGKFIYYFPSGKVKSITVFRKTNQAYTRVFNPEGKRILEGKVIGELKDSTWIFYTDSD